jgi:hypothetical protein
VGEVHFVVMVCWMILAFTPEAIWPPFHLRVQPLGA